MALIWLVIKRLSKSLDPRVNVSFIENEVSLILKTIIRFCEKSLVIVFYFWEELKLKKFMEQHKLSFFTEYYQFYILDSESEGKTDAPDFWNDEAGTRRLAIGEGLRGVTVAKYAEIKV